MTDNKKDLEALLDEEIKLVEESKSAKPSQIEELYREIEEGTFFDEFTETRSTGNTIDLFPLATEKES